MIWFKTDRAGRWPELQNKLELNDLDYPGRKLPEDNALDNIRTMHAKCLKDGAPSFPCPTSPTTYTDLIKILKEKGLISSYPSDSNDPAASAHTEQVIALFKIFKYETLPLLGFISIKPGPSRCSK